MRTIFKWLIYFSIVLMMPFSVSILSGTQAKTEAKKDSAFSQSMKELLQTTTEGKCISLHVVFLIDQSESMSGNAGARPNDPYEQRVKAPLDMVNYLIDNVLDQCKDASHQVAVISIGTKVSVDLDFTEIHPTTIEQGNVLKEYFRNNIKAKDIGQTNVYDAFKQAKKLFDSFNSEQTQSEGQVKQVIILLTDGVPYINDSDSFGGTELIDNACKEFGGCDQYSRTIRDWVNNQGGFYYKEKNFPFDPILLKREQCLAKESAIYGDYQKIPPPQIENCFQEFQVSVEAYKQSTYIFPVLIGPPFEEGTGAQYPPEVYNDFKSIADAHGGILVEIQPGQSSSIGIPTTYRKIFSQLMGVYNPEVKCGPIAVNPFLRRIHFVFYKDNPATTMTLSFIDSNNTNQKIDSSFKEVTTTPIIADGFIVSEHLVDGANERFTIDFPTAGIWRLSSTNCTGGFAAFYQEAQINTLNGPQLPDTAQVDQPVTSGEFQGKYVDPAKLQYITYQMMDQEGNIIEEDPDQFFRVNFQTTMTDPGGKKTDYIMQWDAVNKQYKSTEPIEVQTIGTYTYSIKGSIITHEGDPVLTENLADKGKAFTLEKTIFDFENRTFQVFPVTVFTINPVQPTDNARISTAHGSIIEGWPLPIKPLKIVVRLQDRDSGQPIEVSSILTDPSAFKAYIEGHPEASTILTPVPGTKGELSGEISNYGATGDITLVLEMNPLGYSAQYRPEQHIVPVDFTRFDLPWTSAGFYNIALILLIAAVALLVFYNIWIRRNKVTGTLEFQLNGQSIRTFGLSSNKNWIDISKTELSDDLDLKKLRIHSLPKPKAVKQQSDDVDGMLGTDLNASSNGVKITGVTMKGNQQLDFNLDPDSPTPYSPDTLYEMLYKN